MTANTDRQAPRYESLLTAEDVQRALDEGRVVECAPPECAWVQTFMDKPDVIADDLAAGWQYRAALATPPPCGGEADLLDRVASWLPYEGEDDGENIRARFAEFRAALAATPGVPVERVRALAAEWHERGNSREEDQWSALTYTNCARRLDALAQEGT